MSETPLHILFLDVDGVLNSRNWFVKLHDMKIAGEFMDREESQIDPDAVSQLNRILDTTGCHVVISSTWRRFKTIGQLLRIFVARGLNKDHWDRFIGKTPVHNFEQGERGYEIQAWLDDQPHKPNFTILDDDADMVHLMPHLVKTNNAEGLTEAKANEVIDRMK